MDLYRSISGILNIVLGSSSYGSVAMPGSADCAGCKAMTVKTRTAVAFTLSTGSAGDTYFSVGASDVLRMKLAKNPEELIFWVKADSDAPTLEVILYNF